MSFRIFPTVMHGPFDYLSVSDTKLNFEDSDCGSNATIIGKISNESSKPISHITFSVEVFGEDGEVVDFFSDEVYDFVLLPNSTSSFKVGGKLSADESVIAGHSVTIVKAQESGWM